LVCLQVILLIAHDHKLLPDFQSWVF